MQTAAHPHPTASLARHPDWPQRLALYLQTRQFTAFAWAENDCCTFAANAVMVMTGSDPMLPLRGRYTSEKGALRLIARAGGLQPLVCRYLGLPMERPHAASRGDVVLLPASNGPALGVCTGAEAAAAGPDGVVMYSMNVALAAWKV